MTANSFRGLIIRQPMTLKPWFCVTDCCQEGIFVQGRASKGLEENRSSCMNRQHASHFNLRVLLVGVHQQPAN